MSAEKRLFIYKNEPGSEGKVMNLKSKDNIMRLKKSASKKLNVKAKRVFLQSGAEITDVDELQNNDTLYISQGEPFYKSVGHASGQETFHMSVLGSGGVGKSALTLRFVRDYFVKDWDPTIEDAYRKAITVDDGLCMLEILDTAGQDDFESLRGQWMMDKDGYVFVYSMDSRISLHELQPFFDLHLQINESKRPLPPIVLVANKKDVVDQDPSKCQVSTEEGRRIARSYNAHYIETSALTGANVTAVFENFVREVRKKKVPKPKKSGCSILQVNRGQGATKMANERDEETKQSEPLSVHEQASPPPSPAAPIAPAIEAALVAEAAPVSIAAEVTEQQANEEAAVPEAAPPVVILSDDDDDEEEVDVTEQQIASCRSALRHRLKSEQSGGGDACRVMGVESCVAQIELLFERTVQFGENQSGLLLGSVGSATRAIVLQAMRNLRHKHGAFTHVYLNGTILQNEIEAFKEITSQLTRNRAVKHQSLSYWNMYEYLKGLLAERAAADEPVMVILDSFEKFALETGSSKQLLLYNLLDWLQSKDIKMGVLGISDNFNVIDNLEKRVRSRFSSLQIVIDRPTFLQVKELMAVALSLRTIDWDALPNAHILRRPSDKFVEQFDAKVAALFKENASSAAAPPFTNSKSNSKNSSALLLASLQFDYDIGKPLKFFLRVAAAAVFYLSVKEPFVSVRHFQDAKHLLEQDHQLATLKTINDHGIALMIGMSQLEKDGQRFFTLEMVYARWQAFYRKHDLLHQLPTRSEAQKALENLLRLQLVKDAGDAFRIGRSAKHAAPESLQPEYRVVHLNFAPRTLEGMIRNRSIKCSTAMVEWAVNGAIVVPRAGGDLHLPKQFVPSITRALDEQTLKRRLAVAVAAMVVGFLLNGEDGGNEADGKHPTRKKYLVARSNEQTNSIFDYVHLSTTLLRKVRFGQPIELAIQKPLKGAKSSSSKKKQLINLKDVTSFESWTPIPSDTEAPQHQQQSQQSQHQGPTKITSKTLSNDASRSKTRSPSSQATGSSAPLIRYGHIVRFQAADGGFLVVESDGCLRKVPQDHASDPRTLITLFARDPITNVGKQNNRRVHSGDWAFIVQGSAAALETELGIARADSDEMVEGPAYLVDEVMRHDDTAAIAASVRNLRQSDEQSQQQHHKHTSAHHSHVTKQAIRKKQLEQAFPQEIECMPTTVWSLQKVSESHGVSSSGDKSSASPGRSSCFRHGAQLQIFQNNFVVCYELQSSKDDDDENGNNSRKSRRRSSAMSSFPLGAPPAVGGSNSTGSAGDSRASLNGTLPSESQISGALSSSLGHSNKNGSIFTHVWLQETREFAASYHPTKCSCSASSSSNSSSCNPDRRKTIWDNTWTICDINVVESHNSRDTPLSLGSPQQEKARRRSKPSATATTKVESLISADSSKSEEPIAPGDEDDELDPLSEEQEEDEEDAADEEQETPLQRQASVFDVAKFAVKAETQQASAARIIVRFFRRLFRDEVTQSSVQDFLRRRRRLTLTKRNGETKLSTKQQLKLLQCYNPNVYGGGSSGSGGSTKWQNQQRGLLTFDKFTNSAEANRQKLAKMKYEVDFLNRDWLCTERHSVQKMTSISHEMYSRRPLSSPFTSKRILVNRERGQQFHVEMKMARRDPPSFHYGGLQAVPATRRPQTAPLAIDPFGAKSP